MLIFDLETNGLLKEVTKTHCLVIRDTLSDKTYKYRPGEIEEGIQFLQEADCIAGHNIIRYDIPVIQKLFPWFNFQGKVLDTLVWANLVYTTVKDWDNRLMRKGVLPKNLFGSHSLEAWGYRLGVLKGEYGKQTGAWEQFSEEMLEYCVQDVRVNTELVKRLNGQGFSKESIQLEMDVAKIIARQERHGFMFDQHKAHKLHAELAARKHELVQQLQKVFPPRYVKDKEFTPKADNKKLGYRKGCPMTKIKLQEFNPGSGQQVADRLQKAYGWEPTEFTPTGLPKIDESVLENLDVPNADLIKEYFMIDKRLQQLSDGKQAWLKNIEEDGRIHGSVNTNGAVTGRMTHSHPNLAQVPGNDSPYGYECRELFTVQSGYKLVGCDASGLEARCKAHYLKPFDDGAFIKTIFEGSKEEGTDLHNLNAKVLESPRSIAKRWYYA